MIKPIKFRGVTPKGKIVFGNYYAVYDPTTGEVIDQEIETFPTLEKSSRRFRVEHVDRLIGTDENGKEFYENDIITIDDGKYKVKTDDTLLFERIRD